MNRVWLIVLVATLSAGVLMTARASPAAEPIKIDLTQWTPPDIAMVASPISPDTIGTVWIIVWKYQRLDLGSKKACSSVTLKSSARKNAVPLIGFVSGVP